MDNDKAKECPACGKTMKADAAFCTGCGCRLTDRANTKKCSSCGEELEPDAAFCTSCGNRLEEKKTQSPDDQELIGTQFMALANDFLSVRRISPTRFEFSSQTGAQAPVQKIRIKYEALAQLNAENKQLIFWEKMVESSAGMNTGVFGEKTVQKGIEVTKEIHGHLLFGGKYGFEYGKLRQVVKAITDEQGWAFKTAVFKPGQETTAGERAPEKKSPVLKIFLSAVALLLIATFGAIAYLYISDDSSPAGSEEKLDNRHQKNKGNADKIKSFKNKILQKEGADADGKQLIETDQDTYHSGDKIKVHYFNAPGGSNDWICIVPAGAADTEAGNFQYIPKRGKGVLVFQAPQPGKYEARAFYRYSSGRYKVTARYGFTVKN